MARSQIRSTFEDGNDAPCTKALVCAVFVEVEPSSPLVVEEVDIELGKLLFHEFFVFFQQQRKPGSEAV